MRIKTVNIADDVAEVLRNGHWKDNVYFLPYGRLVPKLYKSVDKILIALGGKWNRGKGGHLFEQSAADEMRVALGARSIVDQKRTLEQFFTPPDLASRMCELAGVRDHTVVLEPSAGSGRLVDAALACGHGVIVLACEIDGALAVQLGKSGVAYHPGDFMAYEPRDTRGEPYPIDAVVMNPPFSANQDIAHVMRAFEFLKPGGKLVAIMSAHWTFANDRQSAGFRNWVGIHGSIPSRGKAYAGGEGGMRSVYAEELPAGTFKAEGTNVSAVLVMIEKTA